MQCKLWVSIEPADLPDVTWVMTGVRAAPVSSIAVFHMSPTYDDLTLYKHSTHG